MVIIDLREDKIKRKRLALTGKRSSSKYYGSGTVATACVMEIKCILDR
jgi:hypothetical protein